MDEGTVEIRFDGIRYGGWQKAEVKSSVDDLCASLRLDVTLPGTGDDLGITANSVIDVLIDGQPVTKVRLDKLSRAVKKDSHDISIEGRSLARELVDSQYSKTLSGLTLGEIAKRLCADFKVPLNVTAQTAVVEDFSMQCEAPATSLINAARSANLLFYPRPDGGLILTEPTHSAPVAALVYGEHLLDYEVVDEFSLRFHEYCVKGYDDENDEATLSRAIDEGITFFRPMHLMADKHGQGLGSCERRAELERNRRLARAHRIELTVQGWRYPHDDGWRVWDINTQVRIVIPDEDIDDVLLIGDRTFHLDDKGGHTTKLTVMAREAFTGGSKKGLKGGKSGGKKGGKKHG